MARQDVAGAVADALVEMGVEHVAIDRRRSHPRVLWEDRGGTLRGIVTCPGSASDRRSMINCVMTARRMVRQARGD